VICHSVSRSSRSASLCAETVFREGGKKGGKDFVSLGRRSHLRPLSLISPRRAMKSDLAGPQGKDPKAFIRDPGGHRGERKGSGATRSAAAIFRAIIAFQTCQKREGREGRGAGREVANPCSPVPVFSRSKRREGQRCGRRPFFASSTFCPSAVAWAVGAWLTAEKKKRREKRLLLCFRSAILLSARLCQ